ncbi:MAG: hypothetical protein DMD26_03815 [Gemmatimonadetes bacterium]|nr:MAG: hypothetical protein DMD26_03815 [Gemmatimonadota bacterium]
MDALEFSDRLRTVLSEARQEAARLQHAHVGTEHMLIALLDDSTRDGRTMPSLAGVVLDVLGVDRARMHEVLELAMAEARVSKATTVDTQHLLLALVREERGIAAQVLLDFGVTVDKARAELARLA